MGVNYFDSAYAIEVHDIIIDKSGGSMGIMSHILLESTLGHIQNDDYYPNIEDKISHLFFSFCKYHCFVDGNKRSAIALSAYFMELNGLDFRVTKFIREMENIVVFVADNKIDKALSSKIIYSILYERDYNDELKLEIIEAIS